jgi:hypothetical protein
MRKGLIATAVAVVLFAVGAFAASFAVSSEDTASGSNPVKPCADDVRIEFNELYSTAMTDWYVNTIDLFLTGDNLEACTAGGNTAKLRLVLQNDDDTIVYDHTAGPPLTLTNVGEGRLTLTVLGTNIQNGVEVEDTPDDRLPVGQVWNAAVLIDGIQISTTPALGTP